MTDNTFDGKLWFNSNKSIMSARLENSDHNSGVGITIKREDMHFFSSVQKEAKLCFDDGSEGNALVKKASFDKCRHLIDECIGIWARKNGLWKLKLSQRHVYIKLRVIDHRTFRVSK